MEAWKITCIPTDFVRNGDTWIRTELKNNLPDQNQE